VAQKLNALLFDVFGTCVDWRSSIVRQGADLNRRKGLDVDWAAFADAWRALYQPSMEQIRSGSRPWTILDVLHRESLDKLVVQFGLQALDGDELDHLNRVWHRLDPWPDTVAGLQLMKRNFIIAPLSNGNVALLVNMAKRAGMPWDAILGAEVAGYYKPQPEAYLASARLLGLEPRQCMMVAAHNNDLVAVRNCGFRTAFVCRPGEHGPGQTTDLDAESDWDVIASSFIELAEKLTHNEHHQE
jgi:2-haloacid dehalogenase